VQRVRRSIVAIAIASSIVVGAQGIVASNAVTLQTSMTDIQVSQIHPETSSHGQMVTLTGSGFAKKFARNNVRFFGSKSDATILSVSKSKMTVLVPDDATSGPVTVTVGKRSTTTASPLIIIDVPDSEMCNLTTGASRQVTKKMLGKTAGQYTNGPTVIKVPDWVEDPFGRYYMYFADHHGLGIRLAFSDSLSGPWTVSPSPVLRLNETLAIREHIASPDIYIDDDSQTIYMTVHGEPISALYDNQVSVLVESHNGNVFAQDPSYAGSIWANFAYARILKIGDTFVRINPRKHLVSRSDSITGPFSAPVHYSLPISREHRHASVVVDGSTIVMYYTRLRDAPERIYRATIDASQPWGQWALANEQCVRRPERSWEGARFPVALSKTGPANFVNQLRDPFIYDDGTDRALFYSFAGESGIGMATFSE
jgi:hypothetical protein